MNIKISIHNGIGDIVKLFPYIQTLLLKEHKVTLQTVKYNHDLIKFFFDEKIVLEEWYNHWFHTQDERYDRVVNLNHLYGFNDVCVWKDFGEFKSMGIDPLICYEFLKVGLKKKDFLPEELSPSYLIDIKKEETSDIILFTKSTAGNRTLNEKLVENLSKRYKDCKNIIIDPEYDNTRELAYNINNAKFVITMDTGPLHISEACKTKYHALLTIFSHNKFMKYYQHGTYSYPSIECSPCDFHHNYCHKFGDSNYKCQDNFKFKKLVDIIDKQMR